MRSCSLFLLPHGGPQHCSTRWSAPLGTRRCAHPLCPCRSCTLVPRCPISCASRSLGLCRPRIQPDPRWIFGAMGFQNRVSLVWCIDVREPAQSTPLQARVQDLTSGTSRRTAPCSSRAPFRRTLAAADRLRLPCLRFLRLRSRLRRKGTGLARVTGAGASFSTCTSSSSSCRQDSSVQAPNGARARASSRRRRRRRWQWTSELHHLQTHPPFHRCTTVRFWQDPLEPSPHPRSWQTHLVEEVFRPTELFLGTILMDGRCGMCSSNATGLETKEPHPRRKAPIGVHLVRSPPARRTTR